MVDIKRAIGSTSKHLMFIHAVTGCDTVSALFRQGKSKGFNLIHLKRHDDMLDTFTKSDSTHDEVRLAGEMFLLKLYGGANYTSLDKYRHAVYKKTIGRASLSSSLQLESLPPTSAAAKQHSFRTYHTVQEWMGNQLEPTQWGWRNVNAALEPIATDKAVAPDVLLNMISCGCKEDVCKGMTCSCKKLGLYCGPMCTKCKGESCHNNTPVILEDEEAIPTLKTEMAEDDNDD